MHDNDNNTYVEAQPRITPYDTGKIKIGVYYEPPKPQQDEDELLLQGALLGDKWMPSAIAEGKLKTVAYITLGICAYITLLSYMMR